MKTERIVLLTTPKFKRELEQKARKEGVSVAEFVRSRCEESADAEAAELGKLAAEVKRSVVQAQASLDAGLAQAQSVLAELRARREPASKAAAVQTSAAL